MKATLLKIIRQMPDTMALGRAMKLHKIKVSDKIAKNALKKGASYKGFYHDISNKC